jgi:transcriptional regulator with XRE-family HTH domain
MINKPLKSELEQFVINKVREKRTEAKLSQKHLANELNVAIGFLGHVESPIYRSKYNLNHLNKLAKIFKCSIKDFLPDPYLETSNDL